MTFLVSFDGRDLSAAALRRAADLAGRLDERLVVVSVVPTDPLYAVRYGWIDDEREFDHDRITEMLGERALEIAPTAVFRPESVHAYASHNTIAKRVKRIARDEDASVVFIGSDNAGRFAAPVSSVGDKVSSSADYDVYIVRSPT